MTIERLHSKDAAGKKAVMRSRVLEIIGRQIHFTTAAKIPIIIKTKVKKSTH